MPASEKQRGACVKAALPAPIGAERLPAPNGAGLRFPGLQGVPRATLHPITLDVVCAC